MGRDGPRPPTRYVETTTPSAFMLIFCTHNSKTVAILLVRYGEPPHPSRPNQDQDQDEDEDEDATSMHALTTMNRGFAPLVHGAFASTSASDPQCKFSVRRALASSFGGISPQEVKSSIIIHPMVPAAES